jgi:excisionase family DNA binding protein
MDESWLTLPEVAGVLRVSPRTLYSWREEGGGPPGYRVGRRLLFKRPEVDAWVRLRADGPGSELAVALATAHK